MVRQDGQLERVAPDFTRPEPPPIGPQRLADYRARLLAAGITHGFSHYGDAVEFIVSTQGLAISGSGKSFVHAEVAEPMTPQSIDGDLDAAVGCTLRQGRAAAASDRQTAGGCSSICAEALRRRR